MTVSEQRLADRSKFKVVAKNNCVTVKIIVYQINEVMIGAIIIRITYRVKTSVLV